MQPRLDTLARRQGGVWRRRDAVACGITNRRVDRLRRDAWQQLRRGIYCDRASWAAAGAPERHRLLAAAACLAWSGARASHRTAAVVHGLPLLQPPEGVDLTHERLRHREPGLRIVPAALPAEDWAQVGGLPTTALARTVVDLARRDGHRAGVVAADAALRAGAARAELERVLRRCWTWPGVAAAIRAVQDADGAAESPLESLSRLMYAEQGLPRPLPQQWLALPCGRSFRVDFLLPGQRTVGEADGAMKYARREDVLAEKRREDALRDAGLEVVRFDWAGVTRTPAYVAERHRRAFARARATLLIPEGAGPDGRPRWRVEPR